MHFLAAVCCDETCVVCSGAKERRTDRTKQCRHSARGRCLMEIVQRCTQLRSMGVSLHRTESSFWCPLRICFRLTCDFGCLDGLCVQLLFGAIMGDLTGAMATELLSGAYQIAAFFY